MINVELKRWAHLLNDMQEQHNDAPEMATDFDVVLLLCDLVTLIRQQIAKTIRLEVEASQAFIVHLAENTLRQAILNLVVNAAQALSGSGFGHICIKVFKSQLGLIIQVFDNGCGFAPHILTADILSDSAHHHQSKINSGLAMTHRFIHTLGGSMKLNNIFPHGACVTLLLPAECVLTDF